MLHTLLAAWYWTIAVGTRVSSRAPRSRVESRRGPGFDDADVSSTLPIIPYGGVSPIRPGGRECGADPPYHSVRRVFPDTAGRLACRAAPSHASTGLSLLPAYTD